MEGGIMKVGCIFDRYPAPGAAPVVEQMIELERRGVELEIFSLEEPGAAAPGGLRARVTVVRPLAPRSIFQFLEEKWKQGHPQTLDLLDHYHGRFDAEDPWRAESLNFCAALVPLVRERGVTHLHGCCGPLATATALEVSLLTGLAFSFTLCGDLLESGRLPVAALSQQVAAAAFCQVLNEADARRLRLCCGRELPAKLHVAPLALECLMAAEGFPVTDKP